MKPSEFEVIMKYLPDIPAQMLNYFDIDSDDRGAEKARVLTALHNGQRLDDIPDWENAFELLPVGEHWD